MSRRKRITGLVVLGLAAVALSAPTAQAMPVDLTGPEVRAIQQAKQRANNKGKANVKVVYQLLSARQAR